MTVEETKEQLALYRQQQGELRKKAETIRRWLREQGVNPDVPAVDLTERNRDMYNRYLNGESYKDIAALYKLTAGRVRQLCKREERRAEREARKRRAEDS